MPDRPETTPARQWTARVRSLPSGDVVLSLGGVEHVMSDDQAYRLQCMLVSLEQGFYRDSGEVKL